MANPVAIYSPDPAAQTPRGGTASAQLIQIDLYRSGAGARLATPALDATFEDAPQRAWAGVTSAPGVRAGGSGAARRTGQPGSDATAQSDDAPLEVGRRRASAGLSFAAQLIAQQGLSPGLHFENYKPAIAAYAVAAQRGNGPQNGQALEVSA